MTLAADGPDRVRVSGVRGTPPPDTLKVGVNNLGGFRNSMTFVLCGLDIPAKAALVRGQIEEAVGKDGLEFTLARTDHPDADRHRGGERAAARTPAGRRQGAGRAGLLGRRGGTGAGLVPGLHADHAARRRHAVRGLHRRRRAAGRGGARRRAARRRAGRRSRRRTVTAVSAKGPRRQHP